LPKIVTYNPQNFEELCIAVCKKDKKLKAIIKQYGFPKIWVRPFTFETFILTILEQQVSLAAAYAAFNKLKQKIKKVTPKAIAALSEEELKACYFTRQKVVYAQLLAQAFLNKTINLKHLATLPDEEIKAVLLPHKGIGHWTIEVILLHALQRTNIFPIGDIALVNSMRTVYELPKNCAKEELLAIAEKWAPLKTMGCYILWHKYITDKGLKVGI
jgi:DNA-3-methyladenine glycosylase II